jgi:uncharacterized membrane protein YfcA
MKTTFISTILNQKSIFMEQILLISLIGLIIGSLGSMLGIGGGVLLIPVLTGLLGLPIKTAIGASIVSVIATSSAAGAVYLSRGLTHTRLAMIMEIATTLGALAGGITATLISGNLLSGIFGVVLIYVAYTMGRNKGAEEDPAPTGVLDSKYVDPQSGEEVQYGVKRFPLGLGASFLAGNISGLLGIGGGVIKVPVMTLLMGIPMRAAVATSNFMIGITAATSAVIYYQHGYIDPRVAAPTALGVLAGAQIGSRLGGKLKNQQLKKIFRWLLVVFAIQMFYKAVMG